MERLLWILLNPTCSIYDIAGPFLKPCFQPAPICRCPGPDTDDAYYRGGCGGPFFKYPIFGSVEIVGFLAVAVGAAALPHTYKVGGHVGVEIITRLLPRKTRLLLDLFTRTLTLMLFAVVAWQMFVYAKDMQQAGEVSMNLEFPLHYIVLSLAVCLGFFSGTIFQQIVDTLNQLRKGTTR